MRHYEIQVKYVLIEKSSLSGFRILDLFLLGEEKKEVKIQRQPVDNQPPSYSPGPVGWWGCEFVSRLPKGENKCGALLKNAGCEDLSREVAGSETAGEVQHNNRGWRLTVGVTEPLWTSGSNLMDLFLLTWQLAGLYVWDLPKRRAQGLKKGPSSTPINLLVIVFS